MTDPDPNAPPAGEQSQQQSAETPQPKPDTDWKAEARKHEARAKEGAAAIKRLAELEEAQKTNEQKLSDRVAAAEKDAADARLEALRLKVGTAANLPSEFVDLLKGDNEEELREHAQRLSQHFKDGVRPKGDVDQGRRGNAPKDGPAQEFASFLQRQLGGRG